MAALRQSQGIVLCQAVGSAPCDEGVGGPKIKDDAVKEEPEEFTLRVGERRGQKAFVDTTRIIGTRGALHWSIQTGRRCARRCMMEWSRIIGSPCTAPCGRRRSKWASRRSGSARACCGS